MSDKIVIELQLDPELSASGKKKIESESQKAGKKSGKKFEDGFKKNTINLGSIVKSSFMKLGAAVIGIGIARTFSEGIRLASIQEDAVNRLNNSLRLSGDLTASNSRDLQDYASSLQQASRFGDEVILNNLALAKSFGATNEQAKQIASAAVDLSAALGIDLNSATRNVAKTLGGYAGELGETIPQLKALTQEQLQAGAGVDLIAQKFAGQGKNLGTFSFAVDQLGNSFGDALEGIGEFITKNTSLISILQSSTSYLNDFAGGLRGIQSLLGFADKPVNDLEKIDRAIVKNIDKVQMLKATLEDRKSSWFITASDKRDIKEIPKRIDALNAAADKLVAKRKELIDKQIADKEKLDALKDEEVTKETTRQQLISMAAIQSQGMIVESSIGRHEALRELNEQGLVSDLEYEAMKVQIAQETDAKLAEIERARTERAINSSGDIAAATIHSFKQTEMSTVALGKSLGNLAIKGYGNAAKAIGSALAKGENASQAFADVAKDTAAQAADSIADYYILNGVGRVASSYGADATGYQMIAAGTGLKLLAGALGGGGGSSSSGASASGASGGGATGLQDTAALEEQDIERTEPSTNVEVVVQGSLVQQEELGTFIAETLSDSFGKQGVALTDARIA